ncbi:MAG: YigZ family protein, partial [Alistipes sp.]|nr:YigZ family protein [Alistipes sp.]
DDIIRIEFPYIAMNDVMRVVKDMQPKIEEQLFDNLCTMRLRIRRSESGMLQGKLDKIEGCYSELEELS